jgi:hypothetical protein
MRKTTAGFCLGGFSVGWILFSNPIVALIMVASLVLLIQGIKEEYHYVGRKKERN